LKRKPRNRNRQNGIPADLKALERIARRAPRSWRSVSALRKAGFQRVAGGLREALALARLHRLRRQMSALRKKARLSRREVARRMGTTPSVVSRLEAGNPADLTLELLERYAQAVDGEVRLALIPAGSEG
jgi:DNA-binding transcriptional regulator YiaG